MAFDITKYTSTSESVNWRDLAFEEFADNPLPEHTLRSLRYMCDVEYHTVCYLRDMLVTPSHRDDDVSAFMTMWNREEFWHGEALADVLGAHGVSVDFDELKAKRIRLGWKDRLDPVKQSLMGNIVGKDFVAVHMIWGAVNEWSAIAAYNRLADLEKHPVLAELLRRIAKQEARHVAFYASQARERLAVSKKAQILARLALSKAWRPVGSGIMADDEVTHVMKHLFGSDSGIVEIQKIDTHVAKLPGLQGLTIVEDAMRAHGVGVGLAA
ncbi:ferritin-like domain-containing protein [Naasia lichenicola]|uniref:Ferritin-like domain-containing protein n=1 Tax=Naasia lichenicola TaxID=2565933 RepID=A0A4V3WSM1_9MICO|nr:ferritin-like domain-containing protein [Naasia lichenicola]THG28627.1 ferritin-like domain-containing protein [Naasia lichenicola]